MKRINNHGQEEEDGLIPLVQKLSDWTSSAPSSLPSSGFKFPFVGRRFNSQSGSKTMEVIPDQSFHGRALYDLYQPVRRIASKIDVTIEQLIFQGLQISLLSNCISTI